MNTYTVTIYTRVAMSYRVEAASAQAALAQAQEDHSEASLNEADASTDDGYCVHDIENGLCWFDDENPVDEDAEETE